MRRPLLVVAALLSGCALTGPSEPGKPATPFFDGFDGDGYMAGDWMATSGNMTRSRGAACSRSSVLRVVTKRKDFRDFELNLKLRNKGLGETDRTPAVDWDGVHVFLRYQSQFHLYYATLNRRDNTVVIKKKVPGGPSNNGTYYDLSPKVPYRVPYDNWQKFTVRVADTRGGVSIELLADGQPLVSAIDDGRLGGAPITRPGRVGVRGDNCDFEVDDFSVSPLSASGRRTAGL